MSRRAHIETPEGGFPAKRTRPACKRKHEDPEDVAMRRKIWLTTVLGAVVGAGIGYAFGNVVAGVVYGILAGVAAGLILDRRIPGRPAVG